MRFKLFLPLSFFLCIFLSIDSYSQQITNSNIGSREYVKADSLLYTSSGSFFIAKIQPNGSTQFIGNQFFQQNRNTAVSEPLNGYVFYSGDDGFIAKVEVSDSVSVDGENLFDYQVIQFPYDVDLSDIELIGSRLVVSGRDGFIAYSDNEGQSWNRVSTGTNVHLTNIIDGFNKLYVTGHNGKIIISSDNGESWTQSASGTDRDIHDLHILSNGTGYAVGNNGIVLYTTNEGQSWSEINNFGLYTDLRTIDFFNDDYGVLAGESGTAYRTTDGGETWTNLSQSQNNLLNVDMITPNLIEFAHSSGIYTEEISSEDGINNAMISLWQNFSGVDNIGLLVGADWSTSSYGNFGMRLLGEEPRNSYPNNAIENPNTRDITENPWNNSYSAITQAKDALNNVTSEWSTLSQNEMDLYTALSNFVQGLAYAQLGLKFDQAEIYSEDIISAPKANHIKRAGLGFTPTAVPQRVNQLLQKDGKSKAKEKNQLPVLFVNNNIELTQNISFAPYNEVMDVAKAKLKDAISSFNASELTMPDDFINGFGGMTSSEFSAMVNTLIAELEVMKARTASENETEVDWDEVMTLTINGVATDFHPEGDDLLWYSYILLYHNLGNWVRVDQKIINLFDSSQPSTYPLDGTNPGEATSNDARLTTYYQHLGQAPFPPARGYYFYGNYGWNKYPDHSFFTGATGPMPFIHKASNNLLRAEAIIRTNGNKIDAANLINLTRNENGGLPNLTGSETDQEILDAIYYEWMIEVGPTGNGPIAWYNNRRFDELQEGSLRQLPVPASVLIENGMEVYTFGGVGEGINSDFYVLEPTDDATAVSLEPTIKWHDDENASSYTLRFNSGPDVNDPILFEKTGLTDSSYTVTQADADLGYYTDYSVIISALDANGDVYLTSNATSFRTIDSLTNAPNLINPSNAAVNTPNRITFYWEMDIGNAKSMQAGFTENDFHHFQLSTASDFSSTVTDTLIKANGTYWWTHLTTIKGLENDTQHFWRVASVSEAGQSDWSETFSFTTMPINNEGILQLISPANEAQDVSFPVEFKWSSATNAVSYDLQASFDMDFSQSITVSGIGDTTAVTLPQILPDTSYYWRMRPVYASGTGDWTLVQSFTTELPIPATPSWEPADGAIVESSAVQFSWGESNYAQSYNVQVSDKSDFSTIIAEASELSTATYEVDNLSKGTYYWRISATNASGTSNWSEYLTFEVNTGTSNESDGNLPQKFALKQNYPNPFNPTTNIEYSVPKAAQVQLKVFNMLGQSVATLVSEKKSAGIYTVSFDASSLSSGIYIYVLKSGNFTETRKLTLIK